MKRAFKAVLHGDRVEWTDGAPEVDGPLQVYITVSDISLPADTDLSGKTVFELLQELADMGAFAEIDDPVAWQREIRKDRPLPGREDDAD